MSLSCHRIALVALLFSYDTAPAYSGGISGPGQRVLGTGKDWESEAFKKDVAGLPDTASLEEYAAMPVEIFGEAMLRGMGWSEDKEAVKVLC